MGWSGGSAPSGQGPWMRGTRHLRLSPSLSEWSYPTHTPYGRVSRLPYTPTFHMCVCVCTYMSHVRESVHTRVHVCYVYIPTCGHVCTYV